VGSEDKVLRTSGNWAESLWTIAPALTKNAVAWNDPTLVNEERSHHLIRVPQLCQEPVTAPVDSSDGKSTTWSNCGGKIRLVRVTGSNHPISDLEDKSGLVLRDELATFFKGSEP
jgi:hypothetical protein